MKKIVRFDLTALLKDHGNKDIQVIIGNLPNYPGDSYIADYYKLVAKSKTLKCSGTHLLNYLVLASFRSYYDFLNGINTLDAALCPMSALEIKQNPFINRYGKRIHFLLET